MKVLVASVFLLMCHVASASSYIRYDSVHFVSASTWVPGDLVCREGNTLTHVKKTHVDVKVCESTATGTDKNCVIVKKPLQQPVVSVKNVCVKYSGADDNQCVKYKKTTKDQSKVNIFSVSNHESGVEKLVGVYTIPSCNQ